MGITVDPEFASLIPPLTAEELAGLEESILNEGCRDALVVWDTGEIDEILLDGHNRFAICTKHGIPYRTVVKRFKDRDDAKIWLIQNQFGRRNLAPYQRTELAFVLEPLIAARAREREVAGVKSDPGQTFGQGRTDTQLGALAGVSDETIRKARRIYTSAPEEIKAKLRRGETTIHGEYQKIVTEERATAAKARLAEQVSATPSGPPTIARCDWAEWLELFDPESVDLLLTDPPYSTDVEDIGQFAGWLQDALEVIKPSGRAFVCIGPYPDELLAYLNAIEASGWLERMQILVWTYRNTLGPTPTHQYKTNWQAILHLMGHDAPPLDCPIMNEQFSVQDINAPDGRLGNRYFKWQKPDELAERLVRHSTKPGDLVIDLFAGSGSFLLAAAKLGRVARGCDIDPDAVQIAVDRGCRIEE